MPDWASPAAIQLDCIVSSLTVELQLQVQFGRCHIYNCLSRLKGIRSNPLDILILEFQMYVCIVAICMSVIVFALTGSSEMEELCPLLVRFLTAATKLMNDAHPQCLRACLLAFCNFITNRRFIHQYINY